MRPIDVLRYAAAITLMWASIEKWAYPQWSYPLLIRHPEMTLGFAPDFYMRAAGAIEAASAPHRRDHVDGDVRERGIRLRQN